MGRPLATLGSGLGLGRLGLEQPGVGWLGLGRRLESLVGLGPRHLGVERRCSYRGFAAGFRRMDPPAGRDHLRRTRC